MSKTYASLNDLKSLDRDELIELLAQAKMMITFDPLDVLSARWKVASERASAAFRKQTELSRDYAEAYNLARISSKRCDQRAWDDAKNRYDASIETARRAQKKADRLWAELRAGYAAETSRFTLGRVA